MKVIYLSFVALFSPQQTKATTAYFDAETDINMFSLYNPPLTYIQSYYDTLIEGNSPDHYQDIFSGSAITLHSARFVDKENEHDLRNSSQGRGRTS